MTAPAPTTLAALCQAAASRLAPTYGESEARWMVRIIMQELKGYSRVELAVKADAEVSDYLIAKVSGIVDRLLTGEPLQYIFGATEFYGLRLAVSPAVLIPRPETAELVDLIVRENARRQDLRVLDVCTGSGCIAVALARNLPFAQVEAIDISGDALDVARSNAASLKVKVSFRQADALRLPSEQEPRFDIVVSNPPYVLDSERVEMSANVLDHEPHIALFVPDSDPLRFYLSIAAYAMTALTAGGRLYFELNPLTAESLVRELRSAGWTDVVLLPDTDGKRRFLSATRPD